MRAGLNNAVFVNNYNLVGIADGREPMRNRKGRSALAEAFKCCGDPRLGRGVESAGCLIEDEYRRIFKEYSCNGYALLLSAGQRYAAFADDGIITIRHIHYVVMYLRSYCGSYYLIIRRIYPAVTDILFYGCSKKENILLHDSDISPEGFKGYILDVYSVNGYLPRCNIIKPRKKVAKGRFSSARRPDKGNVFACPDMKINIGKHIGKVFSVPETDLAVHNIALNIVKLDGILRIDYLGLGFEQFGKT